MSMHYTLTTFHQFFSIDFTGYHSHQLSLWLCVIALLSGCHQQESSPVKQQRVDKSNQLENREDSPPNPDLNQSSSTSSFRIVAAESGLDFRRFDDISGKRRILETNGGGVALFDFDLDSQLDVFLTNGCELPRIENDRRTPSALFRNTRSQDLSSLRFKNVSTSSELLQFGFAYGCSVGDYDADGFDDLYVTQLGRNTLWSNNGDGTFTDVTEQVGASVDAWSSSAAFADVNNDGVLDLYVVNYLDESDNPPTLCPNSASPDGYQGCSPAIFEGVADVLFIGDGEGGFLNQTESFGIGGFNGKGLGVVVSNLDRQGFPEIYVANDGEVNFLFSVQDQDTTATSDFSYKEQALQSGLALNENGFAQASMGIAIGDVDSTGTMDLFLTHFFGDTNTCYLNESDLIFRDATRETGLGASSRRVLGFGTTFLDDDNNGSLDLFIANGHVDDRTWMSVSEPYKMQAQFFANDANGHFKEVSHSTGEYFQQQWIGRGVAAGDLNNDGLVDLAVSHQLGPSMALLNEMKPNQNR